MFTWLCWVLVVSRRNLLCGMPDLVPWPGVGPGLSALGAQSLSHWTTREAPEYRLISWGKIGIFFTSFLLLFFFSYPLSFWWAWVEVKQTRACVSNSLSIIRRRYRVKRRFSPRTCVVSDVASGDFSQNRHLKWQPWCCVAQVSLLAYLKK